METIKAIMDRRSVRGFKEDKFINDEDIKTIVECGMYAPLAVNKVSWHLTVVKNKEFLDNLSQDVINQCVLVCLVIILSIMHQRLFL